MLHAEGDHDVVARVVCGGCLGMRPDVATNLKYEGASQDVQGVQPALPILEHHCVVGAPQRDHVPYGRHGLEFPDSGAICCAQAPHLGIARREGIGLVAVPIAIAVSAAVRCDYYDSILASNSPLDASNFVGGVCYPQLLSAREVNREHEARGGAPYQHGGQCGGLHLRLHAQEAVPYRAKLHHAFVPGARPGDYGPVTLNDAGDRAQVASLVEVLAVRPITKARLHFHEVADLELIEDCRML
mmetsp:Transcript_125527/g.336865  ORF Transcript_125527/g.336865 Transcript_125527/m.336865 type:complete len:243 (-) Transcript_125527:190-918(-)